MIKIIPIISGRCLVVELAEEALRPTFRNGWTIQYFVKDTDTLERAKHIDLPLGNWRIIGMLSEVTEEQIIPLVDWESNPEDIGDEWRYRDYQAQDEDYKYSHHTALESLESAILAEGYYLDVNPIEYPSQSDPKFYDEPYDGTGFYQEIYSSAIDDWQVAQSRVLDRSRCLLLGRESN